MLERMRVCVCARAHVCMNVCVHMYVGVCAEREEMLGYFKTHIHTVAAAHGERLLDTSGNGCVWMGGWVGGWLGALVDGCVCRCV